MITKLEKILKEHARTMVAIPQRYEAEMKFNKANFTGDWLQTKTRESQVRRDNDTYSARESARKQVEEVITELRTKVSTMAAKTNVEALTTLSALKETRMSKGELQALVDRYHGDYMAMKMLCDIASNNGLILRYTSIDDLQEAIQKLEEVSTSFIKGYTGDQKNWTYNEGLITIPEHPFANYQQLFNSSTVDVVEKPRPDLTPEQCQTALSLFKGFEKDTEGRAKELTALGLDGKVLLSNYYEALASEE